MADPGDELLRIDPKLERLLSIDEDDGNELSIQPAEFRVGIDVDHPHIQNQMVLERETLDQALRDIAEVTLAARVDLDRNCTLVVARSSEEWHVPIVRPRAATYSLLW